MDTQHDRNYVYINGRAILHSTACRDWLCGECLGRLVTRWYEQEPHYRTVCFTDENHDLDLFIHKGKLPYIEYELASQALTAKEVYSHLPADIQAMLETEKQPERTTAPFSLGQPKDFEGFD